MAAQNGRYKSMAERASDGVNDFVDGQVTSLGMDIASAIGGLVDNGQGSSQAAAQRLSQMQEQQKQAREQRRAQKIDSANQRANTLITAKQQNYDRRMQAEQRLAMFAAQGREANPMIAADVLDFD